MSKKCSICGAEYEGYGNNAHPYDGRCCDRCNGTVVLTARILMNGEHRRLDAWEMDFIKERLLREEARWPSGPRSCQSVWNPNCTMR